MRALVVLTVVASVALALDAQVAVAGSSKQPGASISVKVGPVSVKADASTNRVDTEVSTPPATVDATVAADSSVTTTVDASTPVGGASVDADVGTASTGDAIVPVHVDASAATAVGSTSVRTDTSRTAGVSVQVKRGGTTLAVSTHAGRVRASVSAPPSPAAAVVARPSNEGSPAAVARPVETASTVAPAAPTLRHAALGRPVVHKEHAIVNAHAAAKHGHDPVSTAGAFRSARQAARPVFGAPSAVLENALGASLAVVASTTPSDSGPAPAPRQAAEDVVGATGSGAPPAVFFAIFGVFLMLAAPLVGRWLRSTSVSALQPAFASLPERPG